MGHLAAAAAAAAKGIINNIITIIIMGPPRWGCPGTTCRRFRRVKRG